MIQSSGSTVETTGLKVIGAGFGRTGTLSIKTALEELGLGPCYHGVELFRQPGHRIMWESALQKKPVDWRKLFANYQATVDWPACSFYKELMQVYPEAKVLLVVRDPEAWYESTYTTIYQLRNRDTLISSAYSLVTSLFSQRQQRIRRNKRIGNIFNRLIWEETFQNRFEDKKFAINIFQQHIEEVKKQVPAEKLLVYNVKEGWEPLCAFLGVEIPSRPFPRLNDRNNFIAMPTAPYTKHTVTTA